MYAKGVSARALEVSAEEIGCNINIDWENDRNRHKFTLRAKPGEDKYRVFRKGRRGLGICVHGHYKFFVALFFYCPQAVVTSNYYGKIEHTKDTLFENYEKMRGIVMSEYYGETLDDLCNCTEEMK